MDEDQLNQEDIGQEDIQDDAGVEEPPQEPEVHEGQEDGERGDASDANQVGDEGSAADEKLKAPAWAKELRRRHDELTKQNRELQRELQKFTQPQELQAPQKPKLQQFDFDDEKYESAMDEYYAQKAKYDQQQAQRQQEQEQSQKAWQERVSAYANARQSLKAPDFEESESMVQGSFDVVQQTAILQGFDNSAELVYKIGKDMDALDRLSKIKDPIRFALAVQDFNLKTKGVQVTKKPPPPEKTVTTGQTAGSDQKRKLEQLRENAVKSGDFTALIAARQKMMAMKKA